MADHKLGKRPATYDQRDVRYSDVAAQLPAIPAPHGGYGTDFKDWGELGNGPCDDNTINPSWAGYQGAGDCAWAGPAHEEMAAAHNASRPIPKFTCLNVLEQYAAYCGYDLQTGANDQGSDVRDVLKWRQKKGLLDAGGTAYKIGTYVALEPGNQQQLWEALWLFETVGIGIEFPASAMDQFNAGKAWSVVAGSSIEGGHYIPLVGHPSNNVWTCVTWGRRQTITPQFLAKYCDEAWAYIDPERYAVVTGETLERFADADLERYITAVAGQKAAA
jgi:hypothetical protein